MGFGEKIKAAFRKIRTKLIAYLVIVIIVAIMGVAPFNVSMEEARMASEAGENFWAVLFVQLFNNIQKPLECLKQCFGTYFMAFLNALKWYLILCGFFALIGLMKAIPKHEYQDI